jgi:hypothetical protein
VNWGVGCWGVHENDGFFSVESFFSCSRHACCTYDRYCCCDRMMHETGVCTIREYLVG